MDREKGLPAKQKTYSLEIGGWYRVTRAIVRVLLFFLARVEVKGLEHVPDKGPYLLLTNHLHWLDPPALMAAFPYRGYVFAAAKREKHWFFGPLFRSLDAIWVHRGEVDRRALRQALAVLRGNGVLGMAPEGTRSDTGTLQQGRGGAAYLAYRASARIVPVVVAGQEKVFPALRRLRRARIRIIFGPPFSPPPLPQGGKVGAVEIRACTEEIMYRLAALLPPEYRGLYSDVVDKRPELIACCAPQAQSETPSEPSSELAERSV
jgi:1-acyl-sn-glycerol-3-phosphate acyltransferase